MIDPLPVVKKFVDMAKSKGTERFVLLTASSIEKGGPLGGKVHEWLADSAGVEWCVVRPTWFMENLSESLHLPTIRDESKLYSATNEGKLPWVSAKDIAAVAFGALGDEKSHDCDHVIVGSELLSYDQVSNCFLFHALFVMRHLQLSLIIRRSRRLLARSLDERSLMLNGRRSRSVSGSSIWVCLNRMRRC